MRYHIRKPTIFSKMYGEVYYCNHVVYNKSTLYRIGDKGLCIIQQRYDSDTKTTKWSEIDDWLVDLIYLNVNFKAYFDKIADKCIDGIFPTVSVRQIMWALKMKPLKKERWETVFDRKLI